LKVSINYLSKNLKMGKKKADLNYFYITLFFEFPQMSLRIYPRLKKYNSLIFLNYKCQLRVEKNIKRIEEVAPIC
jgi:hypothetical protein